MATMKRTDRSWPANRPWGKSASSRPLEERFWERVQKSDGCWLWAGYVKNSGYGSFSPIRGKTFMAHRYSYELHHGPVPKGMVVMHLCDVKRCVRPDHLRAGTHADNMADMSAKGRSKCGEYLRLRTHCKEGHPLTRIVTKRGVSRMCRECRNAAERRRRQELRARVA